MTKIQKLTDSSKGCLVVHLREGDAIRIIGWAEEHIPEEVFVESGLERETHITVLYGFDAQIDPEAVCDFVAGFGPVTARLGVVSKFDQPDHDVIKISVESRGLAELHQALKRKFSVETTFPIYNPHLTLAYVKKGSCDHLLDHAKFEGEYYIFDEAVYSTAESFRKFFVPLVKT